MDATAMDTRGAIDTRGDTRGAMDSRRHMYKKAMAARVSMYMKAMDAREAMDKRGPSGRRPSRSPQGRRSSRVVSAVVPPLDQLPAMHASDNPPSFRLGLNYSTMYYGFIIGLLCVCEHARHRHMSEKESQDEEE